MTENSTLITVSQVVEPGTPLEVSPEKQERFALHMGEGPSLGDLLSPVFEAAASHPELVGSKFSVSVDLQDSRGKNNEEPKLYGNVEGKFTRDGEELGDVAYTLNRNFGECNHDWNLSIDSVGVSNELQGHKVGPVLLKGMLEVAQKAFRPGEADEISHDVTMLAKWSGSYAWLRCGFLPEQESWDEIRTGIADELIYDSKKRRLTTVYESDGETLELARAENIDPSDYDGLMSILDSSDVRSAWALAELSQQATLDPDGAEYFELPHSGTMSLGQALLSGYEWDGSIDLADPEARQKLEAYTTIPAGKARKEKGVQ